MVLLVDEEGSALLQVVPHRHADQVLPYMAGYGGAIHQVGVYGHPCLKRYTAAVQYITQRHTTGSGFGGILLTVRTVIILPLIGDITVEIGGARHPDAEGAAAVGGAVVKTKHKTAGAEIESRFIV